MSLKTEKRRRVQTKGSKGLFGGYDWKTYLRTLGTDKAASRTLDLDTVVNQFIKTYRTVEGRPIPMELGARVLRLAGEIKRNFVKGPHQLHFHPGFEAAADLVKRLEAAGHRVEIEFKGKA